MTSPPIRVVLFDAGHTLLTPVPPVPEVYLGAARELGAAPDQERFLSRLRACWERLRGAPSADKDLRASDALEAERWHRFTLEVAAPFPDLRARHESWLARLVEHFDDPAAWRPMPGVIELLDRLRAAGMMCGVVSNWHSALHGILEELEVRERIDFVLVSAEFGWRKPHSEIFIAALDRAGVAPHQAVHVGDSYVEDVLGAASCGIPAVLVGAEPPRDPLPAGARWIADTALLDAEILSRGAQVLP